MAKAKISKKERLAEMRKSNDDHYRSLGYSGTFKSTRRDINDIPDYRDLSGLLKASDTIPGNGNKKAQSTYTGTLITGIATMHKSNAVPITSGQQAIEISQMRR